MELIPPEHPQSQNAWAVVPATAFVDEGIDPAIFDPYCTRDGAYVRVKISPASFEYLEKLALIRALPFTKANERPRVQSWDFAQSKGARALEEAEAWLRKSGIRSRSVRPPTLQVSDEE